MGVIEALFARLRESSDRPIDILGLGECSHDRVLRIPGRLSDLAPLFTDPRHGGKLSAQDAIALGGGQVATALCAASRLGRRTAFAGVVGDDSDGQEVLRGLLADHVEVSATSVLPGVPTRTALILVDDHGERIVLEHRHLALTPPPGQPTAARLQAARIVHVDATFPESALAALQRAATLGTVGSLDLDRDDGLAWPLLRAADLCVVAAALPPRLTGLSDLHAATRQLASQLPGLLFVTLGEAGSLLALPDPRAPARYALHHQPAFPVAPWLSPLSPSASSSGDAAPVSAVTTSPASTLDTTACGDTYRAALLCALLSAADSGSSDREIALKQAMRSASAAAALKCRDLGRRGCPQKAELAAFLRTVP